MDKKKSGFQSVDDYIATFPGEVQILLEEIRATLREAAPGASEKISYGIPTLTLNGAYLIYFAGWKNHISIYPIPSGDEAYRREISRYVAGKGTLKFPLDHPLPMSLIRKTIKLRIAETNEKSRLRSRKSGKGEII